MAISLDHCVIHVSDWETARAFYVDVLGAEAVPYGKGYLFRFGNAQLNLGPDDLVDWPATTSVHGGRLPRNAVRVGTFAEIPAGAVGLLVDSYGLMTLAVNRGSVAVELELTEGAELTLSPVAGPEPAPVTISTKPPSRERPESDAG